MGTKASFIAMFCVMAGMSATVYAAPSIRVIGGDNAYTSAAAASADNDTSSVGTSSRAGSLRVMPAARTTTKAATLSGTTPKTTPNTTTVGRTVTTPRLSIGKYVGASRPVSVSSSNLSSDLTKRLDTMESNIQGLSMDKQDNLDGSEFITINDKNEVVLEFAALKDELSGMTGAEIEMGTNATHLLWRYVGEPTWKELIALDTIRGDMSDYATVNYVDDEIAAAIAGIDLSNYYTKSETYTQSEADAAIAAAVAGIDLSGKVDKAQGVLNANKVLTTDAFGNVVPSEVSTLSPDMSDYYNKTETDTAIATAAADKLDKDLGTGNENKVLITDESGNITVADKSDVGPDMSNYYTSSETDTAITTAVAGIDLSGKVDKAQGAGRENKVLVTDESGNITVADKSAVGPDMSNYYTSSQTDTVITTAVDGKVDIDQGTSEAGKVMAVGSDGKVSASGDYYTKSEVDAAIAAVPGVSGLGDLAYEDLITNDLVSDDAAIERTKMATDIQAALNLIDAAPDDGNQYVLSVVDGVRQWVPVQQ